MAALADPSKGQLSIEVECEWLGITNSEVSSSGYLNVDIEYLLSMVWGRQALGRLYVQPVKGII